FNTDEVTLTATPEADSIFTGWGEKAGDITYNNDVQTSSFPSAERWRYRKMPENSNRWTGTTSGTFPSDRSRALVAYFE
ncbi:MAG: hypothetical protein N2Z74_06685, partial [Syntrophales bacterium]|nr:hypothetical protein [Syntrophales bacterium]